VTHEPVVSHNANLIHFAIHQPLDGEGLKADHSVNMLTIRIETTKKRQIGGKKSD
jgi:hypothetical protein